MTEAASTHLTAHGRKRVRERLAFQDDGAVVLLVVAAYVDGIPFRALPWQVQLWVRWKLYLTAHDRGGRPRIYAGHVWVFDDCRLVTVYALPAHVVAMLPRRRLEEERAYAH